MSVIEEIKEKIGEGLREGVVSGFLQSVSELEKGEVVLDDASTLEIQLYVLARMYDKEARQLYATAYLIENPDSEDAKIFSHQYHIKTNISKVCRELMFLEINMRLKDKIISMKSGAVGMRKKDDKFVVVSFDAKPIPDFLRGLGGMFIKEE